MRQGTRLGREVVFAVMLVGTLVVLLSFIIVLRLAGRWFRGVSPDEDQPSAHEAGVG